jgi:hypothetical protein
MFDRVVPGKEQDEQRDTEAREGRSPDKIASLKLAALVILTNTFLTIVLALSAPDRGFPIIAIVISLFLSWYLYKLRPRAEALAIGLTLIAAAGGVFLAVGMKFSSVALWSLVPTAGLVASLLLLLIGDPTRARRIAAVAIFAVLVGGAASLLLLGQFPPG